MVYLRIKELRESLLVDCQIDRLAYLYLRHDGDTSSFVGEFAGEEEIAAKGFKNETVDSEEIERLLIKPPLKGLSFDSNPYKLIGIYLASKERISKLLSEKFKNMTIRNKYLISKFVPEYVPELVRDLTSNSSVKNNSYYALLSYIYSVGEVENIDELVSELVIESSDIIDLILLEDINKFQTSYTINNITPKVLIVSILNNFVNAIKKINGQRRKDHRSFEINDEYDVQDVLYVILKAVFPTLKEEDPTPRVGAKANRIDLVLREESIMIEVKMIKQSDTNERDFIEQLKQDIQSYYAGNWTSTLICFVYDPFHKTKDKQNFYDLNGFQTIRDKTFEVIVIVVPS